MERGVLLERLCSVHTFLRTRAWAMTRTRRVLSQSPRKKAADGGLSDKEIKKVWPLNMIEERLLLSHGHPSY